MAAKKRSKLGDRETEALVYFWSIFWCAVVLNPRGLQSYRATMASLGLVEKRGKLALTPLGKRVMAFAKADDRPRYPNKTRS